MSREAIAMLLDSMMSRIDGALDYWTMLCLAPDFSRQQVTSFLAQHSDTVQQILRQLDLAATEYNRVDPASAVSVEELKECVCSFLSVFPILAAHATRPLVELKTATVQLSTTYWRIVEMIRLNGVACGVELVSLKRHAETEKYYNNILSNLFFLIQEARLNSTDMPDASESAP